MKCLECNKEATWGRYTQFSGTHPYCSEHAKMEEDFGRADSSYFYWAPLEVTIPITQEMGEILTKDLEKWEPRELGVVK